MGIVASGDYRPTNSSYELLEDLDSRLKVQFSKLETTYKKEVKEIVDLIDEMKIPSIRI